MKTLTNLAADAVRDIYSMIPNYVLLVGVILCVVANKVAEMGSAMAQVGVQP